ncbi:hypothetical protein niasHT_012476 [Heterodera trifolii]|uniref:Transmembrane protein n=1 Tax=Heterodera trifolii TaxID=157864 RepID=A0ABD2KUU4_9BILA
MQQQIAMQAKTAHSHRSNAATKVLNCAFSAPFTFRDCANDTNCDAAAKLCAQYNGNGICLTCADNLCNGIGDLLVAEWEAERQKAIPLSIYAFLIAFGAFLLVVGSVSFFIFVSRFNIRLFRFCSC